MKNKCKMTIGGRHLIGTDISGFYGRVEFLGQNMGEVLFKIVGWNDEDEISVYKCIACGMLDDR